MHSLIYAVASALVLILAALRPISVLRQCSYRIREGGAALLRRAEYFAILVAFCALAYLVRPFAYYAEPVVLTVYSAFSLFYYIILRKNKRRLTKKTARLVAVYAILSIPVVTLAVLTKTAFYLPIAVLLLICLSKAVLCPLERRIEKGYEKSVKAKLEKINPTVIAITGSYGKTTEKNILEHLLSAKYGVCASPQSYNTPQGLAITVNNHLKDSHEILIVEMGARYKGDIERLTKLIPPQYCVLTAIGNQHLATFKTKERLIKEKCSIFTGKEKAGFFNGYDVGCYTAYHDYSKNGILCADKGDYFYTNSRIENGRRLFCIHCKKQTVEVECPLVADYIPTLVTLAFSVANTLGIDFMTLKNRIKTLKEVAHRQQLLYNGKDVIIDDAYNSNERGFVSAVDLLGSFRDKQRVVITPGVVELGRDQFEINRRLAAYAYDKIDIMLCYGVNSKALRCGAREKTKVFPSLNACMEYYKTIQGERAVLFENDLPDVY